MSVRSAAGNPRCMHRHSRDRTVIRLIWVSTRLNARVLKGNPVPLARLLPSYPRRQDSDRPQSTAQRTDDRVAAFRPQLAAGCRYPLARFSLQLRYDPRESRPASQGWLGFRTHDGGRAWRSDRPPSDSVSPWTPQALAVFPLAPFGRWRQ